VSDNLNVLVCGAGIGGLTAALALARTGQRVTVLERAAALEEVGAGLQVSPNAARVLVDLGLGDALEACAVRPQALKVMSGVSGAELMDVPLGPMVSARHGAPYWVVHRGDLQGILARAVRATASIRLCLDTPVEDVAVEPGRVRVSCRSQGRLTTIEGDVLVGADGIWSTVRTRLVDSHASAHRRQTAWRALVPVEAVDPPFRAPATWLWLSPDAHLVHYPVQAGRMVNVVAIVSDRWRSAAWSTQGSREDLLARFAGFPEAGRRLIEAPANWMKWALFDRPPAKSWGEGRVTLLGDAAHPMVPFLAQGAAMAIEDARVLADCLAEGVDPAAALRRYEGLRRPRTAKVQKEARETGNRFHLSGPLAMARDVTLRLMGADRFVSRFDWIYGWTPPGGKLPA
jgi:salicylate hydroxylase